jgi:hypothetical protein
MPVILEDANIFDYQNPKHLSEMNKLIDTQFDTIIDKSKYNMDVVTKDYLKDKISK